MNRTGPRDRSKGIICLSAWLVATILLACIAHWAWLTHTQNHRKASRLVAELQGCFERDGAYPRRERFHTPQLRYDPAPDLSFFVVSYEDTDPWRPWDTDSDPDTRFFQSWDGKWRTSPNGPDSSSSVYYRNRAARATKTADAESLDIVFQYICRADVGELDVARLRYFFPDLVLVDGTVSVSAGFISYVVVLDKDRRQVMSVSREDEESQRLVWKKEHQGE